MIKNILMISTGDVVGGVGRVMGDMELGFVQKGYKVNYIVSRNWSGRKNVYELSRSKLLSRKYYDLAKYGLTYFLANDVDIGAKEEILKHPFYKNADIVHLHNIHGSFFKLDTLIQMSKEKPVVWTLHDKWAITAHCAFCHDCKKDDNSKHFTPGRNRHGADLFWDNTDYLWKKKREIYRKSQNLNIVSPSLWLIKQINGSILEAKPVSLINNGVDTKIFKPLNKSKTRESLGLPENAFVIVYVGHWGRVDPKKGSEYFLKVTHKLEKIEQSSRLHRKNIIFLCIGGTTKPMVLKERNIYYVPLNYDKKLLAEYYSSANMLLYTSLADNFPMVTLEALAAGLPIVSFDVGGINEQIVHKVNGYLARYKDHKDLLRGIDYILSLDKTKLTEMKTKNRKLAVEKYSLNKMVDNYEKLYESLL